MKQDALHPDPPRGRGGRGLSGVGFLDLTPLTPFPHREGGTGDGLSRGTARCTPYSPLPCEGKGVGGVRSKKPTLVRREREGALGIVGIMKNVGQANGGGPGGCSDRKSDPY